MTSVTYKSKYYAHHHHPPKKSTICPMNNKGESWALVTHACNPSYSGGRDQEDHDSKPAQTDSS
jgi:hypothetical protein